MGGMQQQPTMSVEEATKGAGLVLDPMTNMYYQPSTGQFYQAGAASAMPLAANMMFSPFQQVFGGLKNARNQESSNVLNYGGYRFNPFTGSRDGVTGGIFSPIGRNAPQMQEIAPPVGILNSLFGNIDFSGAAQSGQGYGAGRFLGGSNE